MKSQTARRVLFLAILFVLAIVLALVTDVARGEALGGLPPCGPAVPVGSVCVWQPHNAELLSNGLPVGCRIPCPQRQQKRAVWIYIDDTSDSVDVRAAWIAISRITTAVGSACDPEAKTREESLLLVHSGCP